MALSRLSSMPPELKLETCRANFLSVCFPIATKWLLPDYHLDHTDLLALSHVSRFWRSVVLQDKRWQTWFELIVNPVDKTSARGILTRFNALDTISARAIVTLCFSTKCAICCENTPNLFLPLLRRVCHDCLHPEKHAVASLTTALIAYDLNEKDVHSVVILHWEEPDPEKRTNPINLRAKLVSMAAIKHIAIEKHGGEANLTAHLNDKKARLLEAYEKRLAEYNLADDERKKLKAAGDLAGATAVTWKDNKPVPKTRPRLPPLLKTPSTPASYQRLSILCTNFLALEGGQLVAHDLVQCRLCTIIAELRADEAGDEPLYTDFMHPKLLPAHEYVHHSLRHRPCSRTVRYGNFTSSGSCEVCLNRVAFALKEEEDAAASP